MASSCGSYVHAAPCASGGRNYRSGGHHVVEMMADRLTDAWARTDRIFEMLAPDSWLAQPIALRRPFIFYLGHLPAFAGNPLGRALLERPSCGAASDDLFSRGSRPDAD